MEESTVIQIVDSSAKTGVSAKTGKPWSMSRVGLQNGESVFIFNPIEIGDIVESVQNGEFKNWQKKKVDPKHDEIMKALRAIYKAVTLGESVTPSSHIEQTTKPYPSLPEDMPPDMFSKEWADEEQ